VSRASGAVLVDGRRIETLDLPGDPDRRPVVLLHEGLGSVGLWRDFPRDLAAATGRRVVVYSRPGHGRSAPPPGGARTTSFFDREADVVLPAVLAALGVGAGPILVGHSDGATIALLHAARHDVAGVVAMAPHVFVETEAVAGIEDAVRAFEEGDLRERMARHHDDPDHVFRSWSDLWLDPRFWPWSIEADVAPLDAPLLLVHGARDHYGTVEQLDRIEAAVSAAGVQRLVVAAGHSPHLDQPEVVRDAVAGFVARLP
jgi:pimeloyl-ACP methyl ester carboxylesterase